MSVSKYIVLLSQIRHVHVSMSLSQSVRLGACTCQCLILPLLRWNLALFGHFAVRLVRITTCMHAHMHAKGVLECTSWFRPQNLPILTLLKTICLASCTHLSTHLYAHTCWMSQQQKNANPHFGEATCS